MLANRGGEAVDEIRFQTAAGVDKGQQRTACDHAGLAPFLRTSNVIDRYVLFLHHLQPGIVTMV